MNKKTALLVLLENSFWVDDQTKLKIIEQLDTLTENQIDQLGEFLTVERDFMIENEDQILQRNREILEIIGNNIVNDQPNNQKQE